MKLDLNKITPYPVLGVQCLIRNGIWHEVVEEGAECHPIVPTLAEVRDLHVLVGVINNQG